MIEFRFYDIVYGLTVNVDAGMIDEIIWQPNNSNNRPDKLTF